MVIFKKAVVSMPVGPRKIGESHKLTIKTDQRSTFFETLVRRHI
jgi:hypothetical protein